ncbi:MAG: sigma-70 family RNA polymerase sigma factor [Nocardioides sp.]|uniref:sigma-70 family RNA polymerase sigma factor n=1 Tax=Nocardioides sp. TaxID=35761 RepID=UPI003F0FDDCC
MTDPVSARPDLTMPREERMSRTRDLLVRAREAPPGERERLLDEVVILNRCVAESIAARYEGRGLATEDLRQVACEGLVKAVHRFDASSGKDLLTFAVPTVRGELRRHFRDHGWVVRPPRRIQELQQRIGRAADDLRQQLGRDPSTEEVVADMGVDPEEYAAALEAYGSFVPVSLDQATTAGGDQPLVDTLPDESADQRAAEARLVLAPVVRELPARDRRILYLRFFEERTQAEIGAELGVTQMQVSRLLSGIFERVREAVGPGARAG